jgi:small multidrug resistance pump
MHVYWLLLMAAILCEVTATTSMKLSEGFTKTVPSIMMVTGYLASAALITFAIKRIELSIAYAIWAGLGVFLTTVIGVYFFKETVTPMKVISAAMIIAGVAGLYLSQPNSG